MSIIYYYTKNENLPIFLKYGIRLSKNFDKELNINGYTKPYLIGLLNPKDDVLKYNSTESTCLKLDLLDSHCKIIDFSSLELATTQPIDYIPLEEYIFGTYKNPVVLIDTSVISDKISTYNKIIDIPILFDNSEDFYYELQIQKMMEELPSKEVYELLKNYNKNS